MTDYPQKVSDSFNERLRLIRLRRKKENLRFWQEFRIIPRWSAVGARHARQMIHRKKRGNKFQGLDSRALGVVFRSFPQ